MANGSGGRRSGLHYTIKIDLQGFDDLRKARAELDKVRKGWRGLKRDIAAAIPQIQKVQKAQAAQAKTAAQLAAQQQKSNLQQQKAAQQAANTAAAQQRLQQQMAKTAAAQSLARRQQILTTKAQQRSIRTTKQQNQALKRTEQRANRISFTFRRLIGIFAAFQALRFAARGLGQAVDSGRQFNAFLEQSRLGIQSLLAAGTDVYGPNGVLITGPAKFNALQAESVRLTRLLERDARRTAATYEQLVEAFQIAIGPGLRVGLTLDQLRRLSVVIAQAAAAIGLPMNQLNEEIRSLLSGTIQARTTRIAATLGITNEDIRRWREAGTLADNLFKRFRAFELASSTAIQNFNVILTNLGATFRKTLGDATVQQFESLKDSLVGVQDALEGAEGQQFGRLIAEFLQLALDTARDLVAALDFRAIVGLASDFVAILRVAADVAIAITKGIVAGFSVFSDIVSAIFRAVSSLNEVIKEAFGINIAEGFRNALVFALALLAGMKTIVALTRTFAAIWAAINLGSIVAAVTAIATTVKGLIVTSTVLFGVWRGILAVMGPIAVALGVIGLLISAIVGDSEEVSDAAGGLADDFDLATIAIIGSSRALEGAVETIRKLQDEADKFREKLAVATATTGLDSATSSLITAFIQGQQRMKLAAKDLNEERKNSAQEIAQIEERIGELQARQARFSEASARAAQFTEAAFENILRLQKERQRINIQQAELEQRKQDLDRTVFREQQAALENQIRLINEQIVGEKASIAVLQSKNAETRAGVNTARQLLTLTNRRSALEGRLNEILAERGNLGRTNLERTEAALQLAFAQTDAARERALIESRISAERAEAQFETAGEAALARNLREAEISSRRLRIEAANTNEEFVKQIRWLEQMQESLKEQGGNVALIAQFEQEITSQREQQANAATAYQNRIAAIAAEIRKLRFNLVLDQVNNDLLVLAERMGLFRDNAKSAEKVLAPLRARLADIASQSRQLSFGPVGREVLAIADSFAQVEGQAQRIFERLDRQAEQLRNSVRDTRAEYYFLADSFAIVAKEAGLSQDQVEELNAALQRGDRESLRSAQRLLRVNVEDEEIRRKVVDALLEAAQAYQKINDLQQSLVNLSTSRSGAEKLILDLLDKQLQLEVQRLLVSRRRREEASRAELQAIQLRQRAQDESPTAARLTELQAEEVVLRKQLELTDDRFKAQTNSLLRARAEAQTKDQALAIDESIAAVEADRAATLAIIEQRLRRILQLQERYEPESFGKGLEEGIRAMERSIDLFTIGFQTIQDIVEGFAQTAASFIVGLLDPDNYENMGERLINFFKGLVEAILAELIKLAIVRGLTSLIGSSAGNFGPLDPIPQNRGGRVSAITTRRGHIPLTHLGAQGFSAGGDVRDKIPAMLRKGEWVLTPEIVNKYGRGFINALHRGLIDPLEASRLTPAGRQMTKPSDGAGFATGGPVTEAATGGSQTVMIEAERVVDEGASLEVGREHGFKFGPRRTLRNVTNGRTR